MAGSRPGASRTRCPDAIGAFIAWIIDPAHGWQVSERQADGGERPVPLQARHIAVLFRRFVSFGDDVTAAYVQAIEARGVAHLLVGGKAFHGREEVETVRTALAAIEWPDDELSVFGTLKGSLFAIDDEPLLEFRHRFGTFHPFRIPRELGGNSGEELVLTSEPTSHLVPIADALRLLQRLHRGRNYRPVADTIGQLLADTRAHVGFILRPAGEQALANVLHVAELARQYESGGGISFRGVSEELRTAAEREAAEAPILEEGSDGVRLMTVHKAKGLEFPVVILADMTCRISRNDASRYLDAPSGLCAMRIGGWAPHDLHEHEAEEVSRDRAEGVRLAYVAATRARDLLVVPAVGDEAWEGGWYGPLNRALYPPLGSRRTSTRGPKCPAFKSKDSVLQRPNDEPARPATVCPGEHQFAEAGYSVVWWDPSALSLRAKPLFGVRREELIVKDVPRDVVADGRSRYDQWQLSRVDARAAGSRPLSRRRDRARMGRRAPRRGRPWARRPRDARSIAAGRPRAADDRPGGHPHRAGGSSRRGRASGGRRVWFARAWDSGARASGRGSADDSESRDGRSTHASAWATMRRRRRWLVARVLAHDVFVRARAAQARAPPGGRRQSPIGCRTPRCSKAWWTLAFEHEGTWMVVDYKTDREIAAHGEERYRRQVALYAAAISQATGKACDGMVLVI